MSMLFLSLDSPLPILPTCIGCKFIISLTLWFEWARKWGFQSLTKLESVCTFAKYLCEIRLSICICFELLFLTWQTLKCLITRALLEKSEIKGHKLIKKSTITSV